MKPWHAGSAFFAARATYVARSGQGARQVKPWHVLGLIRSCSSGPQEQPSTPSHHTSGRPAPNPPTSLRISARGLVGGYSRKRAEEPVLCCSSRLYPTHSQPSPVRARAIAHSPPAPRRERRGSSKRINLTTNGVNQMATQNIQFSDLLNEAVNRPGILSRVVSENGSQSTLIATNQLAKL